MKPEDVDAGGTLRATFSRKMMLQKIVQNGRFTNLQLKVLSSAQLEKDFILYLNPLGIVP